MQKSAFILFSILLLTACGSQRSEREEDANVQQIQFPMPQGGVVEYDDHGTETWFAYGALTGIDGIPASGVAQGHYFEDGYYVHTVQLNIEPAPEGYFYEGWIIKGESVISTGHLSNNFGDVRHNLRFDASQDYTEHMKVVVTLEPDDGNPTPAQHVAEGMMKVVER